MIASITINGVDYTWILYVLAASHLSFTVGYMFGVAEHVKSESEAKDE